MQETNLYTITVPPMTKALEMLSKLMDKAVMHAESKGTERHPGSKHLASLLNDRLVFDQFNFIKQVQVACDNAKGGASRLAEIEIPVYEDNEKTVPELKARIEKTTAFLETIEPKQIIGKESVKITLPYFPTKYITGFEYATEYLLPNFYFHIVTAYSILRKNGVDIGKKDYINGLPLKDL
ncbi:hypothetical protein A3C86_01160 [Candidatus Kaiserbacteria bacterium RIFCSPHIGHO2_02_FULL_49_16]|uniref:DUF1993 domain-containing protein n=1 Tax=Candidatus Kaiserbacteria bacterium RIFCSPHIGHO2_02_FULL_49_16 TaxID=1798490 RepID=A0A1F6DG88_9BACT|nr:MAG: hypothetical protein A3C86_01160 [Candidatus Kaiserbacteria bacterium RIFCSPHIGHO2_02_FULL_49_16]